MNFDVAGGRRFLLTVASGAVASFLQYMGKLDPAGSTYALVVMGTVGAYIVGNVAQKKLEANSDQLSKN